MLHLYKDTDSFQFRVIDVLIKASLMWVHFTRKIHFTLLHRDITSKYMVVINDEVEMLRL